MRITKEGDMNRVDPICKSECSYCGCEMEARKSELDNWTYDQKEGSSFSRQKCMTCGNNCYFYDYSF